MLGKTTLFTAKISLPIHDDLLRIINNFRLDNKEMVF